MKLLQEMKTNLSQKFRLKKEEAEHLTYPEIVDACEFLGFNLWILGFAIIIACIGLNTDSASAEIGAMLISPLMGPILGIGLSVSINDIDTLKKSLINFGVMILLSVLTAFLFFWLFPLIEES